METLICVKPRPFEYKDIASLILQPKQAIIKIKCISICGTDLHARRVKFNELKEAFPTLADQKTNVIKAMVELN